MIKEIEDDIDESSNQLDLQFNYSDVDEDTNSYSIALEASVVDGSEVSTVKLPQASYPDGVWETCVFYQDGSSQVLEQYRSEKDARAGHRRYVDEMIVGEQK